MGALVEYLYHGFRFGLEHQLSDHVLDQLVSLIRKHPERKKTALSGRGAVASDNIDGLGRVLVKQYMRGGCLRWIVRRTYLKSGDVRPAQEFKLLRRMRTLGIHAPKPIAYAYRGRMFYRGWLFLEEIPNHRSLAEISMEDEGDVVRAVMDDLVRQLVILIEHGVLHIDLHPGNVLVDETGKVFIIDFDKAREFKGSKRALRDEYIFRWRRAVLKHSLPDELSEMFCLCIRQQPGSMKRDGEGAR